MKILIFSCATFLTSVNTDSLRRGGNKFLDFEWLQCLPYIPDASLYWRLLFYPLHRCTIRLRQNVIISHSASLTRTFMCQRKEENDWRLSKNHNLTKTWQKMVLMQSGAVSCFWFFLPFTISLWRKTTHTDAHLDHRRIRNYRSSDAKLAVQTEVLRK